MTSVLCRLVGEVDDARAERLRIYELQRLLIAPLLEETLSAAHDEWVDHKPKLVEELSACCDEVGRWRIIRR